MQIPKFETFENSEEKGWKTRGTGKGERNKE